MHAILVKFGQNWPKFGQKGDQNYICMDKILNEEKGNRKKNIKKKKGKFGKQELARTMAAKITQFSITCTQYLSVY